MSYRQSMKGFLPSSMLDWPGKICSVLFLGGCNFRCPYCHNPELVQEDGCGEAIAWEDIAAFLSQRRGWIDGVSISGGEPTIHRDLPVLCRRVRDAGMLVKLDTNGSRPRVLKEVLAEGLLDFVAMDVKTSLERYPYVAGGFVRTRDIADSIDTIMGSGLEHEFRCTVVPGLVDIKDLRSLALRLAGAQGLVLQQFRSDVTLDPAYTARPGYPDDLLLEWADELSGVVPTRARGLAAVRA